jgi:hypothetical protein
MAAALYLPAMRSVILLLVFFAAASPTASADDTGTAGRTSTETRALESFFKPAADGSFEINDDNELCYRMLATNDVATFAVLVFPAYAELLDQAGKSKVLLAELKAKAAKDRLVHDTLNSWRRILAKAEFTAPAKKAKISFVEGAFEIFLGSTESSTPNEWEKLQQADIYGSAVDGVSAGLWKKLKWKRGRLEEAAYATLTLATLPRDLMLRLESDFGTTIHGRWRWVGLPKTKTAKSPPILEYVMLNSWLVPDRFSFEIVDASGVILTTVK